MIIGIVNQSLVTVPKVASQWAFSPPVPVDAQWSALVWSVNFNLLVAVGKTGTNPRLMTSPDGITWTPPPQPLTHDCTAICEITTGVNTGRLVAVGGYGKTLTCDDGVNWVDRTVYTPRKAGGICWSPERGLLVMVAGGGDVFDNQVSTSPDGEVWTLRATPIEANWINVIWVDALLLFIAISGNQLMTSTDGTNWVGRAAPPTGSAWNCITWSPELNLLVGVGTAGGLMTSTNGIAWTKLPIMAGGTSSYIWKSVCWSPEVGAFVACTFTRTSKQIAVSLDGIAWELRTAPGPSVGVYPGWKAVTWAQGIHKFVAVADSEDTRVMMTS